MTSPYLDKPVRTPREAATDMRLRAQFHPELGEWADRLDRYADDVEARVRREMSVGLVTAAVGHMTFCCMTSAAFLCSDQHLAVKVCGVAVVTAVSYDLCRSVLGPSR